jgi:hypothetical protein
MSGSPKSDRASHAPAIAARPPRPTWRLREEVAERLERGERLPRLERDLIEPAHGLDEEQRAATWLFAWSYRAAQPTGAVNSATWTASSTPSR